MAKNIKNHKKKTSFKNKFVFVFFALAFTAMFLLSPIFAITNIDITPMDKYSKEQICDMLNLKEGQNIFLFNRLAANKIIKNNTYIEKADIHYKLPNKIEIDIKERKVRGYVPYMGAYLYIDENGRVLEINNDMVSALPVVNGLKFTNFSIGEKIDAQNKDAFNIMVDIAQLMNKYELLNIVVRIDVSDTSRVLAYVNSIEINLGNMTNGDQKIRTLGEVVKNINPNDKGTLDLSDLSKPIIFKYLT